MPWTGFAFLIGAAAIAGLPPLNGFVSEWLTLQALLHLAFTESVGAGGVGAVALAALAITTALAVFCFVKVVGLVLLGAPRRHACENAVEVSWPMRSGMVVLAAWCVVLGALPGALVGRLATILPGSARIDGGIRLGPPGTGGLPTLAMTGAVVVVFIALRLARGRHVAAASPVWASGQRLEPALRWTSAGFTKPVRLVLEGLLRPEREITVCTEGGIVQSVRYRGRVPLLIEERVYAPLTAGALRGAAIARRLQSGRLGIYAVYLTALLVGVLASARLGLFG